MDGWIHCAVEGLCQHQQGRGADGERIWKRFAVAYDFFFWHFHEMIAKTKFVFQLTFWLSDQFLALHFFPLGAGLGGRDRPCFMRVLKGMCIPPTFGYSVNLNRTLHA